MKVKSEKKEKSQALGYILSLAARAAMVALFAAAVLNFSGRTGAREEETLRKAVARASVQCYAIEGRYPPSVEYLEENYAVQIRWFRVQCDAGNYHHTHRRVGGIQL